MVPVVRLPDGLVSSAGEAISANDRTIYRGYASLVLSTLWQYTWWYVCCSRQIGCNEFFDIAYSARHHKFNVQTFARMYILKKYSFVFIDFIKIMILVILQKLEICWEGRYDLTNQIAAFPLICCRICQLLPACLLRSEICLSTPFSHFISFCCAFKSPND